MKKGLGKGLNALLVHTEVPASEAVRADEEIFEIEISKVAPNPEQPRKHFEESHIEELAESISTFGIIQPLIVKKQGNDKYVIVAGERRWRAANKAKLKRVPVIVREYSDLQTLEIALIENVQREDLNPIEEANCYKRLSDEFKLTQEEISKKVGSRSHVSNSIRLLRLDSKIQEYLATGQLTPGHGKAILAIDNKEIQSYFARKMVEDELSVREAEEFVRKYGMPMTEEEKKEFLESDSGSLDKKVAEKKYTHFQMELRGLLSTRVNIRDNRTGSSGGKIEINYFSEDDLKRIVELIKANKL